MSTILAIDDRPDNLLSLSALLKCTIPGCHVITALSGRQGIEMAETESPDTILLDIHMPEMDGFEACKILKTNPGTKHIPVIMLTAVRTGLESRVKGLEMGADAFLVKPVDQFELAAQVRVMLRIKRVEDVLRNEKEILEEIVRQRVNDLTIANKQLLLEISERKQTEISLKNSEAQFKKMIEKSPLPMIITDENQDISFFNDKFTELFGYTIEDVSTAQEWWKTAYPEEAYRLIVQKSWADVIETAVKNNTDIKMQEWELTIKDRTKRTCEFYMVPLGETSLIIMKDVTYRRKAERKRVSLEKQLQQSQKMESIGTLAGGIAHDFNNILSSIIGFTELALDGTEKGTELEDDLHEVLNAGMRAKDLVKQILTFARQSDEEVKPIQVNLIVKEVLKFIRSSIPTTIEINQVIESDSFIMGSPTQIHQILMNLCTNATYAMEENGGTLDLSVNDVAIDKMAMPDLKPGEYIEIKVSDTGIGISPQYIHTIFEPYFTTKSLGEGTGLGLAVVHGIIESYGGQINVNSTIGEGTTFSVYLPITKKRKKQTTSEEKDLPSGNETILFVDDEAPIAKMGSKALEQLGYSVTSRTSSIEALELFRSESKEFDLIITDMTMPNMTGDKLAIELIKIRSDIPVILCTGYSKRISEASAAEIGIKAFAYKPIIKADLAKTIRKVLDETEEK